MPITPDTFILNKYKIRKPIGEGGMARVWLAEETAFGERLVAIKEPLTDLAPLDREDVLRRFHQEIRIGAALARPDVRHIVPVYTAEPYEDSLLLVMAYMPGGSLVERIERHPQGMPVDDVLAMARAVLSALQAAHDHPMEIVHRDLKPANVLYDEKERPYLADFGLAQIAGSSGRSHLGGGVHPGSPLYMAPEQAGSAGYLTPAADFYALGCLLFEMLTGKRYKRQRPGTSAQSLRADTPDWVNGVVQRALAVDPYERFQDAAEFLAVLEQQAYTAPGSAVAVSASKEKQPKQIDDTNRFQIPPILKELGIEMVHIPGGVVEIEGKKVEVAEFLTSKTPITVAQWNKLVSMVGFADSRSGNDSMPVTNVSWNDAQLFCRVTKAKIALQSEAQYEQMFEHALGKVKLYPNIWEWCTDQIEGRYVVRSPSSRDADDPGYRDVDNGFRVVLGVGVSPRL